MWERFSLWLLELGRATSQWGSVVFRGPRWIFWGDCLRPDANLTTSAWVGQAAIDGFRWALEAEREIDSVFGAGHCRRAAERRE